jgi:hypothetical protein
MVQSIQLEASETDQQALLNAINSASKQNVPLLLKPGTHLTRPGRVNQIPIGGNGLAIGPLMPSAAKPATIKRPDHSIDLGHPDDNHGLFFVPSQPDPAESSQANWKHYQRNGEEFEFAILVRGKIRIDGLSIDCNMGKQGLETLAPGTTAEHSCMLGFAGKKYPDPAGANPGTGLPRFIFVAFESVELTNLHVSNGGYADEIWFSRGHFHPNIARVRVDRLISTARVNQKRATVDFSGLCQDITITNSKFFKLGCEATDVPYSEMPRMTREFHPSIWTLSDLNLNGIDLGAHGRSYVIRGTRLNTTGQCVIHEAGGTITDSALTVTDRRRLIALDRFVFRAVTWTLKTSDGKTLGLKITADDGQPGTASFLDNVFHVPGPAAEQVVFDSEYSNGVPANHVRVTATGCRYPATFGHPGEPPIAHVNERGRWTFSEADLEGRDPDVALPKNENDDVIREVL